MSRERCFILSIICLNMIFLPSNGFAQNPGPNIRQLQYVLRDEQLKEQLKMDGFISSALDRAKTRAIQIGDKAELLAIKKEFGALFNLTKDDDRQSEASGRLPKAASKISANISEFSVEVRSFGDSDSDKLKSALVLNALNDLGELPKLQQIWNSQPNGLGNFAGTAREYLISRQSDIRSAIVQSVGRPLSDDVALEIYRSGTEAIIATYKESLITEYSSYLDRAKKTVAEVEDAKSKIETEAQKLRAVGASAEQYLSSLQTNLKKLIEPNAQFAQLEIERVKFAAFIGDALSGKISLERQLSFLEESAGNLSPISSLDFSSMTESITSLIAAQKSIESYRNIGDYFDKTGATVAAITTLAKFAGADEATVKALSNLNKNIDTATAAYGIFQNASLAYMSGGPIFAGIAAIGGVSNFASSQGANQQISDSMGEIRKSLNAIFSELKAINQKLDNILAAQSQILEELDQLKQQISDTRGEIVFEIKEARREIRELSEKADDLPGVGISDLSSACYGIQDRNLSGALAKGISAIREILEVSYGAAGDGTFNKCEALISSVSQIKRGNLNTRRFHSYFFPSSWYSNERVKDIPPELRDTHFRLLSNLTFRLNEVNGPRDDECARRLVVKLATANQRYRASKYVDNPYDCGNLKPTESQNANELNAIINRKIYPYAVVEVGQFIDLLTPLYGLLAAKPGDGSRFIVSNKQISDAIFGRIKIRPTTTLPSIRQDFSKVLDAAISQEAILSGYVAAHRLVGKMLSEQIENPLTDISVEVSPLGTSWWQKTAFRQRLMNLEDQLRAVRNEKYTLQRQQLKTTLVESDRAKLNEHFKNLLNEEEMLVNRRKEFRKLDPRNQPPSRQDLDDSEVLNLISFGDRKLTAESQIQADMNVADFKCQVDDGSFNSVVNSYLEPFIGCVLRLHPLWAINFARELSFRVSVARNVSKNAYAFAYNAEDEGLFRSFFSGFPIRRTHYLGRDESKILLWTIAIRDERGGVIEIPLPTPEEFSEFQPAMGPYWEALLQLKASHHAQALEEKITLKGAKRLKPTNIDSAYEFSLRDALILRSAIEEN